jgi:hypothetical protein
MTFFQSFPIPPSEPQPRAVRHAPPPWMAPPAYELPAAVTVGRFLHRSPTLVMAVRSADVFSTGCSLSLSWLIRRGEQDDEDWAALHSLFFQFGPGPLRGQARTTGLMFGIELPDGSKASSRSNSPYGFRGNEKQPEPPTVVLNNGGGGGGEDELTGTGTIWIWPLPPAGDLRLVAQWLDVGLEETAIVLDGGQLRDAAAGVQQYFPGEDPLNG